MKDYKRLIDIEYSEITRLKNYLNDTDYKLLRELDGGEPVDYETRSNRINARIEINKHEDNIKLLEKEWNEELTNQQEIDEPQL